MGTIYRHFPTRADLIIAVYRHQVEACAEAGPALLASGTTPYAALGRWIDLFVDFLVTKHGLAAVLRSDEASTRCTPGSWTASCRRTRSCSTPRPPPARSDRTWRPTS
jgi:AcrR family transcriptional regulator